MTSVDITDWDPAKVEGFLTAIRSDQPGIEISVTFRSDGQQRMSMALSDERSSDYVAHQCQVCDAITVAKVLPLDGIKGHKALKALTAAGESDSEREPAHSPNGDGPHPH
jgi:uncharacterized lipoprotein NlpE involved in copper resistance